MLRRLTLLLLLNALRLSGQACAPCDLPDTPTPADIIPIQVIKNNVFLPVTIFHNGRCTTTDFILDTGTSRAIIGAGTAQMLSLPVLSTSRLVAPDGKVETVNVGITCLRVGKHEFTDITASVQNTVLYSREYQHMVGGMIGMDLIANSITQIDFRNKQLVLNAAKPRAGKPAVDFPLTRIVQGLPTITCALPGNDPVELMIDTGCDCGVTLYDASKQALLIDAADAKRTDASGRQLSQTRGTLESLTCGDLKLSAVKALLGTATDADSFDGHRPGMIGNEILSRYFVEIDLKNNRVRLFEPE